MIFNNRYPFIVEPLHYEYWELEPYIDEKTMHIHHDKHLKTYVDNLNAALKDYSQLHNWTLEQLLYYSDRLPENIRIAVINNGGGVYNHNFYFANLEPPKQSERVFIGSLRQAINSQFGDFEAFKNEFSKSALSLFGSGYTVLASNAKGILQIVNLKNQDTVLPLNLRAIILIDVWEHAYYLKHYNVRGDYIKDWFNIINFNLAQRNYENAFYE